LEDIIWIGALVAFALWWFIIADLNKVGVLAKYNITAYGPLLMLRTFKGQKLLDWIAKPKWLWNMVLMFGIPLVVISMIGMLVVVISTDVLMLLRIESVPAPGPINSPQNIIVIPGLNQFVPFWWGWIALIIAMVVHEFGHAILAKVSNIKVKSLGLLLMPIPIGAFAEIDEEEMFGSKSEGARSDILGPMDTKAAGEGKRKATSGQLINILSAGVVANFLVAIIAFAVLFGPVMNSIAASDSDVLVYSVATGSPADLAGIKPNTVITAIDNQSITTTEEMNAYLKAHPGTNVTISGTLNNQSISYSVPTGDTNGVYILGIISDSSYPSMAAGLKPNMKMVSIDGTPIGNTAEFNSYMNGTSPGQNVTLGIIDTDGQQRSIPVTLAAGTGTKGYIGFYSNDLSDNAIGISTGEFAGQWLDGLKSMPFTVGGWVRILLLPVTQFMGSDPGFSVFDDQYSGLFHPVGWAAPFGSLVYWMANCLFWIGWLNLNVGLFNCLPMIPLDGGHIFREGTQAIMSRFIKDKAKVEKISGSIVNAFAVTLLASLLFMFLAPYLVQWFLR
jgi:membrane-associated protease RseP (regulator of RpoE activity)